MLLYIDELGLETIVLAWMSIEMGKFWINGKFVDLPAMRVHPTLGSSDQNAWVNRAYITVKLVAAIEGLRAHTGGRTYPGRPGSDETGLWVLIGDFIGTSAQIADSRSLPIKNIRSMVAFTQISEAVLATGTVLNIGRASALFGGRGGGFQAEFVSGPRMSFKNIQGKVWHGRSGSA